MPTNPAPEEAATARRARARRRATRGVIAGYIHELSQRHGPARALGTSANPQKRVRPLSEG
jgi:hypothetical protein